MGAEEEGGRAETGNNKDGQETKRENDAYGFVAVCVCM